jgi:hypothetical protein
VQEVLLREHTKPNNGSATHICACRAQAAGLPNRIQFHPSTVVTWWLLCTTDSRDTLNCDGPHVRSVVMPWAPTQLVQQEGRDMRHPEQL